MNSKIMGRNEDITLFLEVFQFMHFRFTRTLQLTKIEKM